MVKLDSHFINGQWQVADHAPDFPLIDPSTEQEFGHLALGGSKEIEAAVASARDAFDSWSKTDPITRLNLLKSVLHHYDRRSSDIAKAIAQEVGSPIDFALSSQVAAGRSQLVNAINELKVFEFEQTPGRYKGNRIYYEAVGVCGLITPWNWPMNQIILKVMPALAAGNTVVLKPSELAPVSAHIFAQLMGEAGLPAGVFNMVQGNGPDAGRALSAHPDVAMVSFTGSQRAGVDIMKTAAETVKRVTLELGGKGANIIFADADPNAVKRGVAHCFRNSGQSCNAPTRMLVERSVYDQAVEIAAAVANATMVGPSSETGGHIGPVISRAQFDRIQSFIQAGLDGGANLAAGGLGRAAGYERGFFVRPTVFSDVDMTMEIARQEIFGPVLAMIPFETEAEAIRIANDTKYGLANFVQSSDAKKVDRIARALRSGVVEANGAARCIGTPFGGYKQSGIGREGGKWGLEDYLEVKVATFQPV